MSERTQDFLLVNNLSRAYEGGLVEALRGVSFSIAAGETVALMGPSGCGKSTLLGLIASLDLPTNGHVVIDGIDLREHLPVHRFRALVVGVIFQFHHLVPTMTLVENVEAPMISLGTGKRARRARAMQLLHEVGLEKRAKFLPGRVSGGERQRAAVARALVNSPRLLLADEPTGNLDTATGEAVAKLILDHARNSGATTIVATHNPDIAARTDRIITMKDGRITT